MDGVSELVAMSNRYGGNADYVLAGGGNTSYKQDGVLWVKGSGTRLATITADGFVKMDIPALMAMLEKTYPQADAAREAASLADTMAAVLPGQQGKRPSVESVLHALLPHAFVLHLHPALVNGLTCGQAGPARCAKLFPSALWIPVIRPGYTLGKVCRDAFATYERQHGGAPQLIFLQNHGVFCAANTVAEIDAMMDAMMDALRAAAEKAGAAPNLSGTEPNSEAEQLAPALRMLFMAREGSAAAVWCGAKMAMDFTADEKAAAAVLSPFTPDHIVYCKAALLWLPAGADVAAAFAAFVEAHGYTPRVALAQGVGIFSLGTNRKNALAVQGLCLDAMKVAVYTAAFGGPLHLTQDMVDFITGWEAESYRIKAATGAAGAQRMQNKVCLVTGAAQGFGEGIVRELASAGAQVVVADMNAAGAKAVADSLNAAYGEGAALAVGANVAEDESVQAMVRCAVLGYGGLDLLVSCAGIAIAGGLDVMTKQNFEKVTAVNYTGYFLCAKYGSEAMKLQRRYAPGYTMDIIEINSKSGLEGSRANFAYAGSKFGGVGLTQSFALELAPQGIKVNAICPGNLLDGPLWSDPERGLFRQYLDAGKVPGAKTVADVRAFYESKVPMGRGCTTHDVAVAVLYLTEQQYETGQALPVTGGQVMLN